MRRHTLPTFAALALLVALQATDALPTPRAASAPVKVRVDPRVELISIVFHLAGNPESSQGRVAAYVKAVDEHFAPFKGHAVVQRARSLREKKGISFDAPMKLAVCLDGIDTLRIRPGRSGFPLTEDGDPRWTPDDAEAFLADLRVFVKEAGVAAFLEAQRDLFEAARARLEQAVSGAGLPEWLQAFFDQYAPKELAGLLAGNGISVPLRSPTTPARSGFPVGTRTMRCARPPAHDKMPPFLDTSTPQPSEGVLRPEPAGRC